MACRPGSVNTIVFGLEANHLVGTYANASGQTHGFLATVPEPTAFMLSLTAFIAMAAAIAPRRPAL